MQTPNASSTTFATAPIVDLLKEPLHTLPPEKLREYVKELRTLATSPQALGKKLRAEGKDVEGGTGKKKQTFEEMMSELMEEP
jgi:hypothetical protein